jgi:hypothetical protein
MLEAVFPVNRFPAWSAHAPTVRPQARRSKTGPAVFAPDRALAEEIADPANCSRRRGNPACGQDAPDCASALSGAKIGR